MYLSGIATATSRWKRNAHCRAGHRDDSACSTYNPDIVFVVFCVAVCVNEHTREMSEMQMRNATVANTRERCEKQCNSGLYQSHVDFVFSQF